MAKLTKAQEEHVEEIVKKHVQSEKRKKEHEYKKFLTGAFKLIPYPALFGFIAVLALHYYYGWVELRRTLLSWTVGIMFVGSLSAAFVSKLKQIFK